MTTPVTTAVAMDPVKIFFWGPPNHRIKGSPRRPPAPAQAPFKGSLWQGALCWVSLGATPRSEIFRKVVMGIILVGVDGFNVIVAGRQ